MLISNSKVAVGDIVSLKLTNGDEIVGRVVSMDGDYYTVSKPTLVVPSPQGIGLINALFSVDPQIDVQFAKSHVMVIAPTFDKLQQYYIQATTGIQTVEKGGLIV
mgnify:CR=1 FL=1